MSQLRVGYVSDADPTDPWAWSGTHRHMFLALRRQGLDVIAVGPHEARRRSFLRWPAIGSGARREATYALEPSLARHAVDVVFAPVASGLLPQVPRDLPVAYLSDATFRLLRRTYPDSANLGEAEAERRDRDEAAAIRRADTVFYPSQWAADSAVQDYGAPSAKVRVVPLGANLDVVPAAATLPERPASGPVKLLFLGRDWGRKGGDLALGALKLLRQRGIEAELTICGTTPPAAVDARHVRVIANLNKRRWLDRRRLRGLLSEAHFLLFPSRAECFGMVCAEANAFGVPVIASDVGGIPVDDGHNGRRVDLRRGAAGFADPIEALWRYPAAYAALRASAREVYDRRLNWDVWGQAVATELRRLAQAPRQEEAR